MTGVDPDARFDKHKAWIQSNRFVRQYGLRLLPQLHTLNGTPSCEQACALGIDLAIDVRGRGYGVWRA